MKPYFLYCNLYKQNYYFCPGFSEQELINAIKENFDVDYSFEGEFEQFIGKTIPVQSKDSCGVFIWVRDNSPQVLAHECLHATNLILNYVGIKLDYDNDKVQAYYLSWLMESLLDLLNKENSDEIN